MNSHSISTKIILTSLPAAGRRVPNRKPALQTRTREEAGMAIYMAAAILGIEIHPQLTSSRLAGTSSNNQPTIQFSPYVGLLIKLYPNPANETLFVEGINESEALITIFDMEGKLALAKNTSGNCQIDISMLKNGIYRLNVQIKNGDVSNHKFIKFKL